MAEKLTPAQEEAVKNRGGKLLVSAAAGSGKTKVLVDRLMSYLTAPTDPANLDEFLIITYTRAAASELRSKIAKRLTERIAEAPESTHLQKQLQRLYMTEISTVHGFCADILKEYAYRLDLDADFRVADENACQELREEVLKDLMENAYVELLEDEAFRAFADTQGLGRTDRALPELITKVYDSARCHPDPEKWLQKCLDSAESQVEDAGQTQWGQFLMEDLFSWLEQQCTAMEKCARLAEEAGMDKVAQNFRDTLKEMRQLRQSKTWEEVHAHIQVPFGTLRFPTKGVDTSRVEEMKAVRNACKEGLQKRARIFSRDSQAMLSGLHQAALAQRGLVGLVRRFGEEYALLKKKRRVLDFGDLEHKTLDLLLGPDRAHPTAPAREIGARYREVMVDEYQDSNAVQDAIFSSITKEKQNCFLVGDVKQSIYQFRLADPNIFLEKYDRFLPAESAPLGEGRRVLLSHNFRSGPEVIEAVNHVFTCCMTKDVGGLLYGREEALREGTPHVPLEDKPVELYVLDTQEDTNREEAEFVATRIARMLREGTPVRTKENTLRPLRPEDIVILLRSPGSVGGAFRQALEKAGIRCATGVGEDLLGTPEVATLRSILQTIANPRQDIPLLSALASPAFGFTAEDLAQIRSEQKQGCIYDALEKSESPKAKAFLRELAQLRQKARMCTLTELLEHLLLVTDLDGIYAAQPGGEGAKENLQAFFQLAAGYEQGNLCTLTQFLEHLEAQEDRGLLRDSGKQSGAVTIMSIHKSKGLEFPVVFLSGLARKFNKESQRDGVLCDQEMGLGLMTADTQARVRYPSLPRLAIAQKMARESLSEELRVLYVAMTRAEDRLIMTYAARKAGEDVKEIGELLPLAGQQTLCREAASPGEWILLSALLRTESGALRALTDTAIPGTVSNSPWYIQFVDTPAEEVKVEGEQEAAREMPEDAENHLRKSLAFAYPHAAATRAPSKQTATGRKGREKDLEAAENAPEEKSIQRFWRQASFEAARQDGRSYGNAMHRAMQYLHFDACGSTQGVREEIQRMVDEGFLTADEGKKIDCDAIARFFETDLGWRIRLGGNVLREFKFSILDDGEKYGQGLQGEQVLLQGVVDCALLEEDSITVLDFKTDRIRKEDLPQTVERYRSQVETYREALERIYEKPVKKCVLYFFHLGCFAEI